MKAQRLFVVLIIVWYLKFRLYQLSGRELWEALAYATNDIVMSGWFIQFTLA